MDWEKIGSFFTIEAVATYIVALFTAGYWIYQAWKSRRGRHVLCVQEEPEFSHISLSKMARKWVNVEYVGDEQTEPQCIDALSQIILTVKNDSDVDALHNVKLEFLVPDARVLRVWWEELPHYLREKSTLGAVDKQKVKLSFDHLKSYKKYKEEIKIGILADGKLDSIEMLPSGSLGTAIADQVWTAKYISFHKARRRSDLTKRLKTDLPVLALMTGVLLVISFVSGFGSAGWLAFLRSGINVVLILLAGTFIIIAVLALVEWVLISR